jgi:hypothetical protein
MESETFPFDQSLLQSLQATVDVLSEFQIRFALIGGMAIGVRSRPRATADVDFLLEVSQLTLPKLLETMLSRGFQFDLEATIRGWTAQHLAFLKFGPVRIDWLKPVLPIYQHVLEKSQTESLFERKIPVASAEGLILTKLIAFRLQDRADIASLVAANLGRLDLEWIRREWKSLIGEGPDSTWDELEAIMNEVKSN